MACDSLGRPVRFLLPDGQSHDILTAQALTEGFAPVAVMADRAYDSSAFRQTVAAVGAEAVIPSTRSRTTPIPHDPVLYRLQKCIERCFNKLNHFRRFATRYDRLGRHFLACTHLAAAMIWMR